MRVMRVREDGRPAFAAAPSPEAFRLALAVLKWGLQVSASADDILLAMASPATHRLLSDWRRTVVGDMGACVRALRDAEHALVSSLRPGAEVTMRTKGLWSTFHKAAHRGKVPNDVLAVRIVVKDDAECFEALDLVHRLWPAADGRLKDYITRPKANGYQALHETVPLPDGAPMEIQIRSQLAHAHAEHGAASHRLYKGAIGELPQLVLTGLAQ